MSSCSIWRALITSVCERSRRREAGQPADATDESGVPYLNWSTCARFSGKVTHSVDLGTHTLFIAEVTEAEVCSDRAPLTYADYQNKLKPKSEKVEREQKIVGWRCKICGYVYEGSALPEDYAWSVVRARNG